MRIKKWMTLVVAFAMAFTVIGFGLATDDVSAAEKAPTKLTLKSTYTTVDIKGKVTVSVKSVTPSDASKSVTWKSSNTKIATVNSSGVVTGKKAGKVTITATSKVNKKTAKITITVKQLKPGRVTLPDSVIVYTGVSKTVKASVPSNIYNAGVVYKCSTSLATITRNGKSVNGKSTTGSITIKNKTPKYTKGYFTLTAYSKENPKAKDTCKVKVYRSISALSFKDSEVEIAAGDKATQTADIKVVSPKSYCKTVTYKSHNPSIATVDEKTGEVTAVKAGTATIEAKAKYGYPAKATYKVTVYDVLEHDNGVYNIGKDAGYSKYEISGVRNGATSRVVLSNEDIANIVGEGTLDMDWMDSASVANKFKDIEFSYTSGGDYSFEKVGNAVIIKTPEFSATRYYAANSMNLKGNDYTLTLYTTSEGTGSSISIDKVGNTVSVSAQGYTFEMTRVGKDTTVKLTSGSRTAEATFTWVKTNSYRITMNPGNISSHNVVVKAYK